MAPTTSAKRTPRSLCQLSSMIAVRAQTAASSIDRGASMAEYGLLIALVGLTAFAFLAGFGSAVLGLFTDVEQKYPDGTPPTAQTEGS